MIGFWGLNLKFKKINELLACKEFIFIGKMIELAVVSIVFVNLIREKLWKFRAYIGDFCF